MRAAVYLRVSSDRQTIENQRAEVEQLTHARDCGVRRDRKRCEASAGLRPDAC
jgi:DNA invertase Pin-like site-specific DNA recombinase